MLKFSLDIGPVKLYLYLLLLWLILAALSPIDFNVKLDALNVIVLIVLNVLLFLGFLFGQKLPIKSRGAGFVLANNNLVSKRLLPTVFSLGLIGFILKMYTLFIIKGVPLTLNVIDIRLLLLNDIGAGKGGVLSLVAGILFPFCLLFIPLYFSISDKSTKEKLLFKSMLLLLIVDSLFSGGGTSIVIVFLYCLFSTKNFIITKSRFILITLGVLTVFALAGYLWLLRLEQMFGGIQSYLHEFNGQWIASYPTSFIKEVDEESFLSVVNYIFTWISYYFIHGVYEFIYLLNNFNSSLHTLGLSQGYLFFKFFGILGIDVPSVAAIASVNVILGHYQTFWGLAYIDFGYMFLAEVFLLGIICSFLYRKKEEGYYSGIIFYPFIQSQLIYSFLSNPLNGQISYMIVSGTILLFLINYKKLQEQV
ncbi:hypothetical protein [Pseudoalteromonas sp. R86517]|uniref:hypothetical protein n=1 Tax=Pseudoalteromonas sp. R86517 TaxID=3093857 RepID=UPI00366CAFAB